MTALYKIRFFVYTFVLLGLEHVCNFHINEVKIFPEFKMTTVNLILYWIVCFEKITTFFRFPISSKQIRSKKMQFNKFVILLFTIFSSCKQQMTHIKLFHAYNRWEAFILPQQIIKHFFSSNILKIFFYVIFSLFCFLYLSRNYIQLYISIQCTYASMNDIK